MTGTVDYELPPELASRLEGWDDGSYFCPCPGDECACTEDQREHLPDVVTGIVVEETAALRARNARFAEHIVELEGALDRVRSLHSQDVSILEPGKWCPGEGQEEPCDTVRAIAGGDSWEEVRHRRQL